MSEELKKTDIKKIAGRGCLIVAGILFLIFLCRYNQIKKESLYDTEGRTFAKATVMNVLQDNETKDGKEKQWKQTALLHIYTEHIAKKAVKLSH